MRPLDRLLCITAGILGMVAFVAGIVNGHGLAVGVGIGALIVGLSVASLVAWRQHYSAFQNSLLEWFHRPDASPCAL